MFNHELKSQYLNEFLIFYLSWVDTTWLKLRYFFIRIRHFLSSQQSVVLTRNKRMFALPSSDDLHTGKYCLVSKFFKKFLKFSLTNLKSEHFEAWKYIRESWEEAHYWEECFSTYDNLKGFEIDNYQIVGLQEMKTNRISMECWKNEDFIDFFKRFVSTQIKSKVKILLINGQCSSRLAFD